MTRQRQWSRCATCDHVVMLCADGWEHYRDGRPVGTWADDPGPSTGAATGVRSGHWAHPTLTATGEVLWTTAGGKAL